MFQDDEKLENITNMQLGMAFWPTGDIYFGNIKIKK